MKALLKSAIIAALIQASSMVCPAQVDYDVTLISPDLVSYAKAVIRNSETSLKVSSLNSASMEVKQAVTIMNERGRELSVYVGVDDRFVTYRFGGLTIYGKDGKKIKSFGTGDLKPMITFAGSTLYSDVKLRYLDPEYRSYPFTAVINYTVDLKGFFSFPDWVVARDFSVSAERTVLSVSAPEDFELRYFEQQMPEKLTVTKEGSRVVYQWSVENLKAIKEEPFSAPAERLSPAVFLAPSKFEMAGNKGSTATWEEFGKFFADLNYKRNILPETLVAKIKEITALTTDTTEIVRKLYSMLQEKTRYVSVQVGIGGWQPIEAMKVHETSYGDCKALSNYMKSMLDAAGIKSHYTVVRAGDENQYMNTSFPSNQFNHVIVCVPRGKDTIWLECTNQRIPFNYLGTFTDDRDVLLISENGGQIAHTRKYGRENLKSRKAMVTLDYSGNSKAEVRTTYSHSFYDEMIPVLLADLEKQKRLLTDRISVPGFTLTEFLISQPDQAAPVISEDLSLSIKGSATVIGNRMILPVNIFGKALMLPASSERNSAVIIEREATSLDTIIYRMPAGYHLYSTFKPVSLSSDFGSYETSLLINGNELVYVRKQTINKGTYSEDRYPEFLGFMNQIASSDLVKVVLEKQ